MLFHVRMDVHLPSEMGPAQAERLKATEKAYSHELQRAGKWRHIWRIAGEYANYSIFDTGRHCTRHWKAHCAAAFWTSAPMRKSTPGR